MSERHIVIVGGGIVGICAAYFLARRGEQVTLLEQDTFDDGASTGNAGLISVGHTPLPKPGLVAKGVKWMFDPTAPLFIKDKLNPALMKWFWDFRKACTPEHFRRNMDVLAAHGKPAGEVFRRLVEDESLDCEYQPRGQYDVFLSEDGMRGGEEEAELMRGYGYEVELVDGDELRRREPAFRDEIVGAALYPERAFCNPGRFVVEMAERARNAGAEMRSGSTVERLLITDDRCAGVELEGGERIEADRVLLAAGIWSSALAKQIDIRLPMQAGKGYHLNLTAPEPYLQTGCVCAERYVAVTPMAGGLRLAGTLEFSGINHEIVQKRVDMLRLGAARYLRGIEQAEPLSTWCGLRPCTADGLPVVGWAPNVGDLFLATGHAMMGFLFGPLTGQVACGCLLEEPPSVDIGPLSPDRFN